VAVVDDALMVAEMAELAELVVEVEVKGIQLLH
jgi:hypothetical protein